MVCFDGKYFRKRKLSFNLHNDTPTADTAQ